MKKLSKMMAVAVSSVMLSGAATAEIRAVKVGMFMFPLVETLPFFTANRRGSAAAKGMKIVRVKVFPGAAPAALTRGDINLHIYGGPSFATQFKNQGFIDDPNNSVCSRIVMPLTSNLPARIIGTVRSFREIEGGKIVVGKLGSMHEGLVRHLMQIAGIDPSKVEIVAVRGGTSARVFAMLRDRSVRAAIAYDPSGYAFARLVPDISTLVNYAGGPGNGGSVEIPRFPATVLVARCSDIAVGSLRRKLVVDMINLLRDEIAWLSSSANATAVKVMIREIFSLNKLAVRLREGAKSPLAGRKLNLVEADDLVEATYQAFLQSVKGTPTKKEFLTGVKLSLLGKTILDRQLPWFVDALALR